MIVATFLLPPEAFTLERTVQELPDAEVEADRLAAHSSEWTMPDVWVANADFGEVDEVLRDDPTVETVVDDYAFDDEKFYHVKWADEVIDRIDAYVDMGGSILRASASDGVWRVRIRFVHRDQFDDFRDHVDEQGHSFEVLELTEPGAPHQSFGRMTPGQRDALVVAMEAGYYRVPREISSEGLAERLGISQQALSERLRRGVENLVDSTLTTHERGGNEG